MQMVSIGNRIIENEFNRIVLINEAIKKISMLSYKVKLRALNTLIIARKSNEGVTGFAVISSELIIFSNQLQSMTDKLSQLMRQILNKSAKKAKIIRMMKILAMTIMEFQISNDENSLLVITDIIERENNILKMDQIEIAGSMKDLFLRIKETIKLCIRGRTISVFGKIESAYAVKDKELYLLLSENVENYLDEAENILKKILTYQA